METEEVEAAIEELEVRLERLRSLYEQYFLGIEKIEPTVARKDVDRRIWTLRREQIRNTARRFKLQTIIQRYNTFQQYWQRICREIENGTYKRHLLRAEKNFGPEKALTIAARKRFRKRGDAEAAAAADKAAEAQNQLATDLGAALDDKSYDPLEEAKRAVDAALGRTDASRSSTPAPEREQETPSAPAPRRAASVQPRQLNRLELDLDDDLLGSKPAASARPAAKPAPADKATPAVRPAAAVAARAPDRAAAPVTPMRPAAPAGSTSDAASPAPPTPPARSGPPAPPARPAPPPRPPPRAARPGQPAAPARPAPPARSTGGSPPAAPSRPRPPPSRAQGTPGKAGVSDDRARELHAKLVDAQKRTNGRQDISVDRFKKKLEAVESKLRARHGNRRIDFDVVIKDGKAVVKPIVR